MASKSRENLREHVLKQLRTSSSVGKGKLGNVYKVKGFNGEQFALKVSGYLDATRKEEKYLLGEVDALSRFQHPHIVQYIDGWDTRDSHGQLRVYILTEYCSGGDLRSYLNNTLGRPPPEADFGAWLAQIASGLDFIHSMGILHRNVKTPNIMVDHLGGYVTLKIGDFGMSKMLLQPDAMAMSQVGTPYFMSPEILNGRKYNMKTDIWSFGCTAYEMATLTTIFHAKTITTLLSGINKHKATQVTKHLQYSIFFQTLIGDMLQRDPSDRPDAGEILTRLIREGYKTTHHDMTASATLTSTMSSTSSRTRSYQIQGQLDSKAVLWSGMDSDTSGIVSGASSMVIHDNVSNPPWRDIDKDGKARSAGVAVIPPVIPNRGGRPRTKSEGCMPDIELGLLEFTKLRREKKQSELKPVTEQEVTEGKEKEEAEELMSAEDRGKILRQIEEQQRSLAQTLGDGVFTAAFSTLNIHTDTKMERELASVLGDKYEEFWPRFVVLRALEIEFTEQRDDRDDRKPLNKTI
ncbi:serine/threonine-protein kinase nekl-2-like [Haliotis asinina]|uniref:serine/threonine-protein kinase nekl-2-like n=1 Tax=Haliotis asinina TaxID=109174 RepID=UPI0035327EFF